jgi:mRNA interferase HicA
MLHVFRRDVAHRPRFAIINNIVYNQLVTSKEFKRWLAQQGALFKAGKGSHLKVYLNGKQSVLPMHNAELKKGLVEGIKQQLGLK